MVDHPTNPATEGVSTDAPADAIPSWRATWQVPALVAAGLLLIAGIVAAFLTAPKPDYERMLRHAESLVEAQDYPGALAVLNQQVLPHYDSGHLNADQGRRFHLLRARAVYLGEKKAGVELAENARNVLQEFKAATDAGATLERQDQYFLADANITLGHYERALELAAALPQSERERRARILKRIVERELASPREQGTDVLRLLAEFLKDPALNVGERAWALARQAELLLRRGRADQAITKLVQTMPALLEGCPPEQLGELYLLLGRAYWDSQAIADAGKQLEQAVGLLPETVERHGEALVLLAKVEELTKQPPDEARQEARQKYASVAERFSGTSVALPALLGLGEVEAALGDFEASLSAYGTLTRELAAGRKHPDVSAAGVASSLMDRFQARFDAGETAMALRYAGLAESLFTPDTVPPPVLLGIARANRRAAEDVLRAAQVQEPVDLARLDPATREQVRLWLVTAGRYFRRHAERVGVADNAAFGESLWYAADSLDRAGDSEQAIPLFGDFAKFFPADPRQAEARFRMAQAHQARGEYDTAAGHYRSLRDDAAAGNSAVGPYGDLSVVPLAQTLLMDLDPANDAEAQALLEEVVQGRAGGTSTPQFRDGLVELARLKHRNRDFAGAIMHLEEAVARFPDDPRIEDLKYELADAYRQDAHAIEKTLGEGMPDHRKQALREARVDRLRKARELFGEVRRLLESHDPRRLSRLDQLRLRNACFYLADCDFDLGEYESAIRNYDAARERYPKDPASLVAMMQIVNAYVEMGDLERARTANNRAMQFYESLPETAWNDPDLPMGPDDWKHWLESMSRLRPMSRGQEAEAPGEGR